MKLSHVVTPIVMGLTTAALIAGCGSNHSSDAARASAAATSSVAQAAKQSGAQIAAKCLGANPSGAKLLALATSKADRDALAQKCGIPVSRRAAFKSAVANSALAWGEAKGFNTKAGREAWAFGDTTLVTPSGVKQPSLPQLIGEYQS